MQPLLSISLYFVNTENAVCSYLRRILLGERLVIVNIIYRLISHISLPTDSPLIFQIWSTSRKSVDFDGEWRRRRVHSDETEYLLHIRRMDDWLKTLIEDCICNNGFTYEMIIGKGMILKEIDAMKRIAYLFFVDAKNIVDNLSMYIISLHHCKGKKSTLESF